MGIVPDIVVFAIVMSTLIFNIVKLAATCKNDAEKKQELRRIKWIVWIIMVCVLLIFGTQSVFLIIQPQLYHRALTCFVGVIIINLSSNIFTRINGDKKVEECNSKPNETN